MGRVRVSHTRRSRSSPETCPLAFPTRGQTSPCRVQPRKYPNRSNQHALGIRAIEAAAKPRARTLRNHKLDQKRVFALPERRCHVEPVLQEFSRELEA